MMAEIDDDSLWSTFGNSSDDEENCSVFAEQAMDRLACALGGAHILPPAFACIPQYLASDVWNERYAALMCIGAIAEGCAQVMATEAAKLIDMIIPRLLADTHPRVRYAACNAIGQLCTDFAPVLQENHHSVIVPAICETMALVGQPRYFLMDQ
eukprot:Partr_v1_DN28622_c1_g1_i1_m50537 putative importin